MKQEEIIQILPERIRRIVQQSVREWDYLQEIHIRSGGSIILVIQGDKVMPDQGGQVVGNREFREILEYISNYSMYAFEEELKGLSDDTGRTPCWCGGKGADGAGTGKNHPSYGVSQHSCLP